MVTRKVKHPCKGEDYEIFRNIIVPEYLTEIINELNVNRNMTIVNKHYEKHFCFDGVKYQLFCYENTYEEIVFRFSNESVAALEKELFTIYGNANYIRLYISGERITIDYPLEEGIFEQMKFSYDLGNLDFKTALAVKDIFCLFYEKDLD